MFINTNKNNERFKIECSLNGFLLQNISILPKVPAGARTIQLLGLTYLQLQLMSMLLVINLAKYVYEYLFYFWNLLYCFDIT